MTIITVRRYMTFAELQLAQRYYYDSFRISQSVFDNSHETTFCVNLVGIEHHSALTHGELNLTLRGLFIN
jgi:hypothetical protein